MRKLKNHEVKPYRFWVNDSQESGDIASGADAQIPGSSSANGNLNHVQGRSDYVNFFPVALSIRIMATLKFRRIAEFTFAFRRLRLIFMVANGLETVQHAHPLRPGVCSA